MSTKPGLEQLLNFKSIAQSLDVPIRTLRRALSAGKFPRPDLKIGQQFRWKKSTIESWLRESKF